MSEASKRVLIVGAFPNKENKIFGGIATSCKILINSSFSKEFELILLDSTQISNPPPKFIIRAYLAFLRISKFIYFTIIKQPNAIILFVALEASLVEKGTMGWISKLLRIPVFIFPRGTRLIENAKKSALNKNMIKFFLKGGNYFLCQGPTWEKFARDEMGFNVNNIKIIPNWTATNNFLKIGESKNYNINEHINLLFLGWVEKEKGVIELINSCIDLSENFKFNLYIAGKGSVEDEVKELVRNSSLKNSTFFLDWIYGEDLENIFQKCNILVLPSWTEGLPNAMIEAMSSGLAVVVSNVGNIPDLLIHENQAILVEPKNNNSLTKGIESLFLNFELRKNISISGYNFVKNNYSENKSIKIFTETINNVIK